MQDRLNYVKNLDTAEGGYNRLPQDALDAIQRVVDQAGQLK